MPTQQKINDHRTNELLALETEIESNRLKLSNASIINHNLSGCSQSGKIRKKTRVVRLIPVVILFVLVIFVVLIFMITTWVAAPEDPNLRLRWQQ